MSEMTPAGATGDPLIDARLAELEAVAPDDLDAQIARAGELHHLLTQRLSGEA